MNYQKYGQIIRKIREQSNISLGSFNKIGVSKAALSDFERGKSMMSFGKVLEVLKYLGVGLGEFEVLANDYDMTDLRELFRKVEKASLSGDIEQLKFLSSTTEKILKQKEISISIRVIYNHVDIHELEELTEYLHTIMIWSYKELFIFYVMMDHLRPKDIISILNDFEEYAEGIYRSSEYKRALALVLMRALTVLTYYGCKEEGELLLAAIKKYNLTDTMFLRNLFLCTEGYWIFQFEDKNRGYAISENSIRILELLGERHVIDFYKKRFKKYMNGK
ncbi:helix-turn-helix domain-containing protein [Lactococcus lactis]|uniref:Rgg/GadR/MutR family transcriptional regulator n=1 Tax=Lactococcus lactis TaxID=1358 RepID=UPI002416183C|nr:Rgg/GadR/MutR family transcriptional regulator [Lactococcus lactis]MDG4974934.1 helix-turn-helix domain-containing protein [Lactococcus lactis]